MTITIFTSGASMMRVRKSNTLRFGQESQTETGLEASGYTNYQNFVRLDKTHLKNDSTQFMWIRNQKMLRDYDLSTR